MPILAERRMKRLPPETLVTLLAQRSHEIGLSQLSSLGINHRYSEIDRRIRIGRERTNPEMRKKDGGSPYIRTGIPDIREAITRVPPNSESIVADFAGTTWKVQSATKENGTIKLGTSDETKFLKDEDKKFTWNGFINQMADSIMESQAFQEHKGNKVNIGIAFGFEHDNKESDDGHGIDAVLTNVKPDGSLVKGWQITDWDPEIHDGNITTALRKVLNERLQERGITVGTLVAINDTNAVALDTEAIAKAKAAGYEVLPASMVTGTGTNASANGVNLEIGHFLIDGQEDTIHRIMRENGWVKGPPEPEHETGKAIAYRVAAALMQLHSDHWSLAENGDLVGELLKYEYERTGGNEAILDDLATAKEGVEGRYAYDATVTRVTNEALDRAAQHYGMIAVAVLSEALRDQRGMIDIDGSKKYAILTEGSVLLKGKCADKTLREKAEEEANKLLRNGATVSFVNATGLKGIGALAMSYEFLEHEVFSSAPLN